MYAYPRDPPNSPVYAHSSQFIPACTYGECADVLRAELGQLVDDDGECWRRQGCGTCQVGVVDDNQGEAKRPVCTVSGCVMVRMGVLGDRAVA